MRGRVLSHNFINVFRSLFLISMAGSWWERALDDAILKLGTQSEYVIRKVIGSMVIAHVDTIKIEQPMEVNLKILNKKKKRIILLFFCPYLFFPKPAMAYSQIAFSWLTLTVCPIQGLCHQRHYSHWPTTLYERQFNALSATYIVINT